MSSKESEPNPIIKFGILYILFALALFLPAGTLLWLEGWIFYGIMITFSLSYMFYLKKNNPDLLRERTKTTYAHKSDKIINTIGIPFFLAIYIIPGFDFRFQWSNVPLLIELIGFLGIVVSLILFILVSRENTYMSRIVEIQEERGHEVITTGPYKYVRHPMYVAVIGLYFSQCIALGSVYALIPLIGIIVTILLRTHFEDKILHEELQGYKEYARKTKYRLIPGIW